MTGIDALIAGTPDADEVNRLLTRDPGLAAAHLRAYAVRGEPHSALLLGFLLVNGVGTPKDELQALRYFQHAARARIPMGMNMVGRCHEYGLGTAVDYLQAAHWYYRAAAYECDWAIYNYAQLLAHGRGVARDRAAAFAWFRHAAARGHARAMNFLAQYYENGWETPMDRDTAVAWYRRSAEAGDFRGQCSYASVLAEQGRVQEALGWLQLAVKTATAAYLAQLGAALAASPHEALRVFAASISRHAQ